MHRARPFCVRVYGGSRSKVHFAHTSIYGHRTQKIPHPVDLRSQAEYRLVSTMVGDHMGILGVVVFAFLHADGQAR